MNIARPRFAPHPFAFGRGRVRNLGGQPVRVATGLSDDLKLFVTTFAAGFLFVSVLIG